MNETELVSVTQLDTRLKKSRISKISAFFFQRPFLTVPVKFNPYPAKYWSSKEVRSSSSYFFRIFQISKFPKAPSLSQLCSWLHSCLLVPGWCKSQTLRTGIRTQYREKKPGYQWTSCWPWAWKITVRLVLISWVVIGSETGDLVRIIDSIFFTQASDVPDYAKPIS